MTGAPPDPDEALPAGSFSPWLEQIQGALDGRTTSEVPCGSCAACCMSAQFVHIEPDETDTLAHIPAALLFPAPRRPRGHVVLGHDEQGRCPMLVEGACSIYEHRPRACRTYDCRIFAAAGIAADKPLVDDRVRRWRFSVASPADRVRLEAVRSAARSIREHPDQLPDEVVPANATGTALLAIELHDAFIGADPASGEPAIVEPEAGAIEVALRRRTRAGQRP